MVYEVRCQYCGKPYRKFRAQGKFCSDSCRVGNARLPARLVEKANIAIDYIAQMRELTEKYPQLYEILDIQLERVQAKVALERLTLPQIRQVAQKAK